MLKNWVKVVSPHFDLYNSDPLFTWDPLGATSGFLSAPAVCLETRSCGCWWMISRVGCFQTPRAVFFPPSFLLLTHDAAGMCRDRCVCVCQCEAAAAVVCRKCAWLWLWRGWGGWSSTQRLRRRDESIIGRKMTVNLNVKPKLLRMSEWWLDTGV